MSDSKLNFGKDSVPSEVFYDDELGKSASKIVAERRAYAIFSSTGAGLCGDKGAKPATIESANVSSAAYTDILSGPRLVPPPSLTSVDWSNDGANDIIDSYLWKATVNFVCYSPEQFNSFDRAFFQHFNEVKLTIGWINYGGSITITGTIVDFQFTINEKLQYDCSVTFAGAALESAAAFGLNVKDENKTHSIQNKNGIKFFPQSIVGVLKAQALQNHPTTDPGTAKGDGSFGVANISLNATSWLFWQKTKLVHYVSLSKLIATINTNLPENRNFKDIKYNVVSATQVTPKIKSANPLNVLNQGNGGEAANYAKEGANFGWNGGGVMYFVSFDFLEKIEYDSPGDKSDNPHATKNTLIQFIRKVLDEINNCLGDSIKLELIPYGQSGEGIEHGYEITDRKTLIQNLSKTTVLNPLNKTAKIRNINIQSTIDSEIAAIALSSAQSGDKQGVVQGVFGCKPDLPKVARNKQELVNMYDSFKELDETILNECIQTLKKICNVQLPQQIGYKYGVTLTVTVDGYGQHLFGKVFKVTGLPTILTKANVYFIVLKQSHKFDNGDWTMDLEGQMMFDITNDAKIITGFDPTGGLSPTQTRVGDERPPAGGLLGSLS